LAILIAIARNDAASVYRGVTFSSRDGCASAPWILRYAPLSAGHRCGPWSSSPCRACSIMCIARFSRTSSICLSESLAPRLDGLPSAIECGNQDANGVRIKYACLFVIVEELEHLLAPQPGMGRDYIALFWRLGEWFPRSSSCGAIGPLFSFGFAVAVSPWHMRSSPSALNCRMSAAKCPGSVAETTSSKALHNPCASVSGNVC
jgi:hypothetical protein